MQPIDAGTRDGVLTRAAAVHAATGIAPLGDAAIRDLLRPGAESFVVTDGDALVHAMRDGGRWTLGEVASSERPAPLAAALDEIRRRGGGPVTLWIAGADRPTAGSAVGAAGACGLRLGRRLLRLETPLPVERRPVPTDVVIDAFDASTDVDAWLAVNNRAFASHPEQGGWDAATFAARRAEPWFRAQDLRIARRAGRIVGSCWTKRTDDPGRPPIGEIHVVAVDPDAQGAGLGAVVVTEGLAHLATACGAEIGMLYVDASNAGAVDLYERLGFVTVREDHAFEGSMR